MVAPVASSANLVTGHTPLPRNSQKTQKPMHTPHTHTVNPVSVALASCTPHVDVASSNSVDLVSSSSIHPVALVSSCSPALYFPSSLHLKSIVHHDDCTNLSECVSECVRSETSSPDVGSVVPSLLRFDGRVSSRPARVLVDSGATNNFINRDFVVSCGVPLSSLDLQFAINFADGSSTRAAQCARQVPTHIGTYQECVDYVVVPLGGYDVILGKAWLDCHNPKIDWPSNTMRFFHKGARHVLSSSSTSRSIAPSSPTRVPLSPTRIPLSPTRVSVSEMKQTDPSQRPHTPSTLTPTLHHITGQG